VDDHRKGAKQIMIPEQRRLKMIEKLRKDDICSIDSLTEELGVSRITIQRDVNLLVKHGLAEKIHGGVQLKKAGDISIESRFNLRLKQNYEKKLEMAKTAVSFVKDSSIIFLDSSTTIYILANEIVRRQYADLTIITNSPAIIIEGMRHDRIRLIATGGELRPDFNMFAGSWVLDFLEKVNINSAFVSAAGITMEGSITSNNRDLANTIKEVMQRSVEVNLLVDSTKFHRSGMLDVGSIKDCTRVITDKRIDSEVIKNKDLFKSTELVY
jgi:DeoR/GlpR family transcriptional regulator of sugar metabolism